MAAILSRPQCVNNPYKCKKSYNPCQINDAYKATGIFINWIIDVYSIPITLQLLEDHGIVQCSEMNWKQAKEFAKMCKIIITIVVTRLWRQEICLMEGFNGYIAIPPKSPVCWPRSIHSTIYMKWDTVEKHFYQFTTRFVDCHKKRLFLKKADIGGETHLLVVTKTS